MKDAKECPGCKRGLPVYLGIHCGEWEMFSCCNAKEFELELVPEDTAKESWFDKSKKLVKAPFTYGG